MVLEIKKGVKEEDLPSETEGSAKEFPKEKHLQRKVDRAIERDKGQEAFRRLLGGRCDKDMHTKGG